MKRFEVKVEYTAFITAKTRDEARNNFVESFFRDKPEVNKTVTDIEIKELPF